jgi:hypothetical protein
VRKLDANEEQALRVLKIHGRLVPGDSTPGWTQAGLMKALNSLVRKKQALVEMTDDGTAFVPAEPDGRMLQERGWYDEA